MCDNVYQSQPADLMGLRLGPVLQSGKDAIVALDDPVLLDGERLDFSGGDGHAKTNLQNPTAYQRDPNKNKEKPNKKIKHVGWNVSVFP